MQHRIRAAAIIVRDERILLVKHVHPVTKFAWWVPPGGGVELEDASIIDCVMREVFEEAGYHVRVDTDVRFVREFFDREHDALNVELFFIAHIVHGDLTMENVPDDSADKQFIHDVRWCKIEELQSMTVYPEILKENFGRNMKKIYLGRQIG